MTGQYANNTMHYLTREKVTWRESMDGSSFLLAAGFLLSMVAVLVWWRRRAQ